MGDLMRRYINLLEGKILPSLGALALPIMAASLIQMAYNLTDMIWIGKIGSNAVASVGAAGMFMWFSNGMAGRSARGTTNRRRTTSSPSRSVKTVPTC